jgi:hypothetical protein
LRRVPPVAAELEELRCTVADRPGTAEEISPALAARFADECRDDFENVYCFDCRKRSRAGILGDIGAELGLRMAGTTEQNILILHNWCAGHRVLFVFAGLKAEDRDFLPAGRASVIFTSPPYAVLHETIRSATADAVRAFYDALYRHEGAAMRLGWTAVRLLKAQERLVEALEVVDAMAVRAPEFEDASAMRRMANEQYWLRNDLGYRDEARIVRPLDSGDVQLPLPFED